MAVITPDIDFAAAKEESDRAMLPAEAGIHKLQVMDLKDGNANGRDYTQAVLTIVESHNPDWNGKKINYFFNLPEGGNMKGAWKLINIMEAAGVSWTVGQPFDTDELKGKFVQANVSVDGKYNNIASFV